MGLGWLIREYVEMCAGKIRWRKFLYLFLPAPPRKQRLRNWKHEAWPAQTDADGREYSTFKGRGAHCSHPDLWRGMLPRIEREGVTHYIVPAADCKTCQYHEDSRRRRKFACCLWDRERHKSNPTPGQIAADSLRKAEAMVSGNPMPGEPGWEGGVMRYRIVGDNSGHEYAIPVDRSDDWHKWQELDEDDERSWDVPQFAIRIDGRFTFTDPRCD